MSARRRCRRSRSDSGGATVKVFDRTNAVFYLGLFQATVGADLDGLKPLAPRHVRCSSSPGCMERQLDGRFAERPGVVLTGASSEQNGLENCRSSPSTPMAWLSHEGGPFAISLRGVDYSKPTDLRVQGAFNEGDPQQLAEACRARR